MDHPKLSVLLYCVSCRNNRSSAAAFTQRHQRQKTCLFYQYLHQSAAACLFPHVVASEEMEVRWKKIEETEVFRLLCRISAQQVDGVDRLLSPEDVGMHWPRQDVTILKRMQQVPGRPKVDRAAYIVTTILRMCYHQCAS